MKSLINAIVISSLLASPGFAADDKPQADGTRASGTSGMMMGMMSHDQMMAMHSHMQQMQALMNNIKQEQNPEKHRELLQQHTEAMHKGMQMMHGGMKDSATMGMGNQQDMGMGKNMPEMKRDDRIDMMEQRMGMMQMMMEQMLDHDAQRQQ